MKFSSVSLPTLLLVPAFSSTLLGSPVAITNASFETLPAGGLTIACGGSCVYSVAAIPGWVDSGQTGQWIVGGYAGNPPAIDGSVLAYTNGGFISQDVSAAIAGSTYTLQVDLLHRTDQAMTGVLQLEIGGAVVATATGSDLGAGTWSNWTATYTAGAADAGKTITILLSANGAQGDFDNVRLDSSAVLTPEPASIVLFGLFLPVIVARRFIRKTTSN